MSTLLRVYYVRALCAVTEGASAPKPWFLQDDILWQTLFAPCHNGTTLFPNCKPNSSRMSEDHTAWKNQFAWCRGARGANTVCAEVVPKISFSFIHDSCFYKLWFSKVMRYFIAKLHEIIQIISTVCSWFLLRLLSDKFCKLIEYAQIQR
jgi:hypothetical protein